MTPEEAARAWKGKAHRYAMAVLMTQAARDDQGWTLRLLREIRALPETWER